MQRPAIFTPSDLLKLEQQPASNIFILNNSFTIYGDYSAKFNEITATPLPSLILDKNKQKLKLINLIFPQ